jgi:rifampicin phosphotransferase
MKREEPEHQQQSQGSADALVLPLAVLDRILLPVAGGKAAQLGELLDAGFAVPEGFCVTTAAYQRITALAGLDELLTELSTLSADETVRQAELAAVVRDAIYQTVVPSDIKAAIIKAYQTLARPEQVSVAVRSSATDEDLPDASFAGQQDSFLNVIGIEATLDAIQRCWASLWTDRAVSYRANHGIDPRTVRIAVVVQRMVDVQVAGVLFTANPLTGKRRQATIDANPGLGEAVVSGATTPDYFVVNTPTGEIIERRLSDNRVVIQPSTSGGTQRVEHPAPISPPTLTDSQIRALADVGARVEAHFGIPQDLEWAIDTNNRLWLLQSRPITTLFPLPPDAPMIDEELRVYLSFTVQQGTYLPFTPMGISAVRVLASALLTFFGSPPSEVIRGPRFITEVACRIFLDVTGALRTSVGRTILSTVMAQAEVHAVSIFEQLSADPRLALVKRSRLPLLVTVGRVLMRTGVPWRLIQALMWPGAAHARLLSLVNDLRTAATVEASTDPHSRLVIVERLLMDELPRLLSGAAPVMLGGMGTIQVANRLLGTLASEEELQVVLRGLPYNPTTEMNMALWMLAQQVHAEPMTATLVHDTAPAKLAAAYHAGSLPQSLQQGLAQFLATYGHRSISELDLGVPRWSENPEYLLGVLASYLQLRDPEQAPDLQFRRAAQEAMTMLTKLTLRAQRANRARGLLVHFFLTRARALGGMREMPRFAIALLLAQTRAILWPVGDALVQAGRLAQASDIFFLSLPEAHAALNGTDLRIIVRKRQAHYEQERKRRHVPLVLLSDGTEPGIASALQTTESGQVDAVSAGRLLRGTPASPGSVTAQARLIHDPVGAHLAAGEILVAPSTDPGWTPLFLTAGGLVMEMGGPMSHGAIVAREYGIPAVVGVAGAINHIKTGQKITVNGTEGTVAVEQ